jgi:signal transduction histidine kinase
MHSINTLWLRLALSFLIVTLLVIASVAVIVQGSVAANFSQYVSVSNMARFGGDLVTELEAYYSSNGGWEGVEMLLPGRGGGQGGGSESSQRGAQVFITDTNGVVAAASVPEWIGQDVAAVGVSRQLDLVVAGRVVGTLGEQTPGTVALNEAEQRFLQDTASGLIWTGIISGLVAVALGIILSYSLTRPLQQLTDRISQWQPQAGASQITIGGTEEVQQLATAFDNLQSRLVAGETQRQRMSADVAHELRTPVTVMRGHLEAMMDGVYPLDAAHLAVAYDQVLHLARLVEDLRLLTQAEAGRLPLNLAKVDMTSVIRAAVDRFAPLVQEGGITMTADLPNEPAMVQADAMRIQQVMDNLLSNAIRHTPDSGRITIHVKPAASSIEVGIYNQSAAPLTDEQIAHLFDRFWRGEDARARDTGGSGLGLAITRELLRSQGGGIQATRAGDGIALNFHLPAV